MPHIIMRLPDPMLLPMIERVAIMFKQLEQADPLVVNIAEEGNLDLEYYDK